MTYLINQTFLNNVKNQYDVFARFTGVSLLGKEVDANMFACVCYNKEAMEKAKFGDPIFLPKNMNCPYALTTSCQCFGNTPNDSFQTYERVFHITYFYNILHLFWLGYFLFLDALNSKNQNILITFINRATSLIKIPRSVKSCAQIGDHNKEYAVAAFVGIYALHILTTENKEISTLCRIEALRLWKNVDTGKNFTKFSLWYCCEKYDKEHKQLLPSSFDPTYFQDKLYSQTELYKNEKMISIFKDFAPYSNRDSANFVTGLKTLLTDYKHEVIQLVNSFLRLDIYCNLVIEFLYQIIDLDNENLTLIFGEKSSYRNKGLVYEITDELNHVGPDMLKIMIINLRQKNKELEETNAKKETELDKVKNAYFLNLFPLLVQRILISLEGDCKHYFAILGFSITQPYSQIKIFLEKHYKSLSLLYHPDKTGESEKQKLLNDAIAIFRDEVKFNLYIDECKRVASRIALELINSGR